MGLVFVGAVFCGSWLACDSLFPQALELWQVYAVQMWERACSRKLCVGRWSFLVGVHIQCCGNGHLGFRSYSGSLLERPKSKQKAFAGMTHPHGLQISSRT
jgi:hypothetical protein